MSDASDYEQHPENTEQTEAIPIVDVEPPLALPPPPPPEDEWRPIPEHTNVNDFQSVQESESKMKSLNQRIESFQNKEKIFLHVKNVVDQNKEILERLQDQNEELNAKGGEGCGSPLSHWVQHRDHCYHQTVETVSWWNCSDLCVSLNATFLKTERSRLMCILKLLAVNHTWLGLSYKEEDNKWKWEDGSLPSSGLEWRLPKPSMDFQGKCVYAGVHTVGIDNCTVSSSCLCEKPICA